MAIKLTNDEIKEFIIEIKSHMTREDITTKTLAELLSKEYNIKESRANLSKKINTGSLRYIEAQRIARVLGYRVKWEKQNEKNI